MVRSEATSGRFSVMWMGDMRGERSDELNVSDRQYAVVSIQLSPLLERIGP